MKKWLVVIFAVLVFSSTALADDLIHWNPVCRHNAIFWAMTVGEQYPTRIVYGWFTDSEGRKFYHVQPQAYMGGRWWYFEVEDNNFVRLITKPRHVIIYSDGTREETHWYKSYIFPDLMKYVEYMDSVLKKVPK